MTIYGTESEADVQLGTGTGIGFPEILLGPAIYRSLHDYGTTLLCCASAAGCGQAASRFCTLPQALQSEIGTGRVRLPDEVWCGQCYLAETSSNQDARGGNIIAPRRHTQLQAQREAQRQARRPAQLDQTYRTRRGRLRPQDSRSGTVVTAALDRLAGRSKPHVKSLLT
jgi:hypothetical protein